MPLKKTETRKWNRFKNNEFDVSTIKILCITQFKK